MVSISSNYSSSPELGLRALSEICLRAGFLQYWLTIPALKAALFIDFHTPHVPQTLSVLAARLG